MAIEAEVVSFIQRSFRDLADPEKAGPMAAYMKTDMPFYGIQKPQRIPVYREMKRRFAPESSTQYQQCILALWRLPHREEKYAAIHYAALFRKFITSDSLPLYERLVRQGQWWDLVDSIAIELIGDVLLKERPEVRPTIDEWIDDSDMWMRRTAIICQIHHKKQTDQEQLFSYCLKRAHEREFFIRKAIGWALREYSYVAPDAVIDFLARNREQLSPLSFKEGAKQLIRTGKM